MDDRTLACVEACLDANVPVILWGAPGTAKTAVLTALCERRGWPLHGVILSHLEPTEVNGWLQPAPAGDVMRRLPPDWLDDACRRGVVVLLDELSGAPPAVQVAALRLLQERRVGDRPLHPETRFVAAANPADATLGAWDLTAAMSNRLVHLQWKPAFKRWASWLADHGPGRADIRAQVVGYLQRAGADAHLCAQPASEAGASGAWPSPRSWTNLCAVLSATRGVDFEVEAVLASGCVGAGEATAFLAYRREADLPDPEVLLAAPEKWKIPARHDRAYAALSAVVAAVSSHLTPARWLAAVKLHRLVAEAGVADLAADSAMPLFRWKLAQAERRAEISKTPLPAADLEVFRPLLQAAGLLGDAR